MTITAPVPGASNSSQGSTVALVAGQATQIQVPKQGVTVINGGNTGITLGSDAYFAQDTVTLPAGASLPWPSGGLLYAMSATNTNMVVMQGTYNYWNPATIPTKAGASQVFNGLVTPSTASNANQQITLLPNTRTLYLSVETLGGLPIQFLSSVKVVGGTTGIVYYNQPPYLSNGFPGHQILYLMVIPIPGNADSALNITYTLGGSIVPQPFNVIASSDDEYVKEDEFYNGTIKTFENANPGPTLGNVVCSGPLRLLTAIISNFSGTPDIRLYVTPGNVTLSSLTGGPAGYSLNAPLTFPPNTILPAGQTIAFDSIVAGQAIVSITGAYP